MYLPNPYRRRQSAADQFIEFEEYDDDEDGIGASMEFLGSYELNPGRGPRQSTFGPGGGYMDGRGWHPGGGRYLDPGYLPPDYPEGTYHPGGGQVSHGFHPGSGYFSNPPCVCGEIDCGCGCEGDPRFCRCRARRNPGRGPRQSTFGAGGGYYGPGGWRPGGGRYLDPRYLPPDYPDGTYHPGGGQVSHGFHPGSGYFSNPRDEWELNPPYYERNPRRRGPRLPHIPRDPMEFAAYNNPPHCSTCRCRH